MSSIIKVGKVQSSTGQDAVTIANDGSISGLTTNNIQPASGQALTIKDEGGTASITVATNGEATFAENIKITNGKGIDFSAVGGSASGSSSAVLDDYEEGTWAPELGVNSGTPSTSQTVFGRYTKIGERVTIEFYVNCSVSTSSGVYTSLKMSTLPFTPKSETVQEYALGGPLIRSALQENEQVMLLAGTNPATANNLYFLRRDTGGGNTIATQTYSGVFTYRV